jgi:hypothetical protein
MMMYCAPCASSKSINSPSLGPVSRSTGLGGMGPPVTTHRLSISVSRATCPSAWLPDR